MSAESSLHETQLTSQEVLNGDFLRVYRDSVRLPDGQVTTREYIRHPGAVTIIPLIEGEGADTRIVLERQYRYPVEGVMIEFPAGKLDAGEDTLTCAQRELREETGYSARKWARAGLLHPGISYSTEFIEIWFAKDLAQGQSALDNGEFLEVFSATAREIAEWCQNGRITDGKTLTGALWLQNVLAGRWVLDWQEVQP